MMGTLVTAAELLDTSTLRAPSLSTALGRDHDLLFLHASADRDDGD